MALRSHRNASALAEVSQKSEAEIERETAEKWLGRALACLEKYRRTRRMKWLIQARGYEQEALEHAALVRDRGKTVARIEKRLHAVWK